MDGRARGEMNEFSHLNRAKKNFISSFKPNLRLINFFFLFRRMTRVKMSIVKYKKTRHISEPAAYGLCFLIETYGKQKLMNR